MEDSVADIQLRRERLPIKNALILAVVSFGVTREGDPYYNFILHPSREPEAPYKTPLDRAEFHWSKSLHPW